MSIETPRFTTEWNPSRTWQTCFLVFLFLFGIRLVRAFILSRDLSNDDCEVDRVALSLAQHMGFANPFKIPTGPTSHVAPAYPLILAGIYKLFGTGAPAEAVRQVLACSVTCFQFALLPALAAVAKVNPRVGVLAAFLGGLSPLRNWIETKGTFETTYTALLLVILTILTLKMWKLDNPSLMQALLHGTIWGIALLFAPTFLPVLFGYLALGAIRFFRKQFRSYLRFSFTLLITVAIVLMPWSLRNYHVFHRLIFVRGNFGLELSLSNNDGALPLFEQNLHTARFQSIGPLASLTAAQTVRRSGESEYYHRELRTAYSWISTHPWRFLRLTAERVKYFWFPPLEPRIRGIVSAALTWSLTLSGIAGLLLMLEDHRWPALAIGVIWLTYPLVYYVLQFDLRYRYPIEWTFVFGASYGLKFLADRVVPRIFAGSQSVFTQ
jgi:hypothetical protein